MSKAIKVLKYRRRHLKRAKELFENEADRLLQKYYSTLDRSMWTPFEKCEVLNATVRLGKLLNVGQVQEVLLDARDEHIQLVVQQPIATVVQTEMRLEEVRKQTAAFMQKHGVSLQNKTTIEGLLEQARVQFEKQLKELKRLQLALKIFGAYYDERIHLRMPSLDVSDKSLVEREWLVTAMGYYGEASRSPPHTTEKYEQQQLQLVDRYLTLNQAYDIAILKGAHHRMNCCCSICVERLYRGRCFIGAAGIIASVNCNPPNGVLLDFLAPHSIENIAITNGEKNIVFYEQTLKSEIEVPQVNAIDTLAAGDVFHGAYCYYRFFQQLTFKKALKMASIVASESVKYFGAREGVYVIKNQGMK